MRARIRGSKERGRGRTCEDVALRSLAVGPHEAPRPLARRADERKQPPIHQLRRWRRGRFPRRFSQASSLHRHLECCMLAGNVSAADAGERVWSWTRLFGAKQRASCDTHPANTQHAIRDAARGTRWCARPGAIAAGARRASWSLSSICSMMREAAPNTCTTDPGAGRVSAAGCEEPIIFLVRQLLDFFLVA